MGLTGFIPIGELIEAIGLLFGLVDVGLSLDSNSTAPTPVGIPKDEPYIAIHNFEASKNSVVVGDSIFLSGVAKINFGHIIDAFSGSTTIDDILGLWGLYHDFTTVNFSSFSITVTSSGGAVAKIEENLIVLRKVKDGTAYPNPLTATNVDPTSMPPGIYISNVIGERDDGTPIIEMTRLCSLDSPYVEFSFQVEVEARNYSSEVHESFGVTASVTGPKAELGQDKLVTLQAPNVPPKIVEVLKPYKVETLTTTPIIKHGERVIALLVLENLSLQKSISWSVSQLDADLRQGSHISSRASGNNKRPINKWAEKHANPHPCYGEESWVLNAFKIDAGIITDLEIDLKVKPNWKESWKGSDTQIDCYRNCGYDDWHGADPEKGEFIQDGERIVWKPKPGEVDEGKKEKPKLRDPLGEQSYRYDFQVYPEVKSILAHLELKISNDRVKDFNFSDAGKGSFTVSDDVGSVKLEIVSPNWIDTPQNVILTKGNMVHITAKLSRMKIPIRVNSDITERYHLVFTDQNKSRLPHFFSLKSNMDNTLILKIPDHSYDISIYNKKGDLIKQLESKHLLNSKKQDRITINCLDKNKKA